MDPKIIPMETLGYWCVAQYQVGCPKLAVRVDKDLGLQNLVQTLLVYKAEVGHSSMWVCKTIKKDKKKKKNIVGKM